jgi:hypothetical protein
MRTSSLPNENIFPRTICYICFFGFTWTRNIIFWPRILTTSECIDVFQLPPSCRADSINTSIFTYSHNNINYVMMLEFSAIRTILFNLFQSLCYILMGLLQLLSYITLQSTDILYISACLHNSTSKYVSHLVREFRIAH